MCVRGRMPTEIWKNSAMRTATACNDLIMFWKTHKEPQKENKEIKKSFCMCEEGRGLSYLTASPSGFQNILQALVLRRACPAAWRGLARPSQPEPKPLHKNKHHTKPRKESCLVVVVQEHDVHQVHNDIRQARTDKQAVGRQPPKPIQAERVEPQFHGQRLPMLRQLDHIRLLGPGATKLFGSTKCVDFCKNNTVISVTILKVKVPPSPENILSLDSK